MKSFLMKTFLFLPAIVFVTTLPSSKAFSTTKLKLQSTTLFAVQVKSKEQLSFSQTSEIPASEITIYQQQQQQQRQHLQQSLSSTALPRALRLLDIVWKEIIHPVYTTLIQRGLPSDDDSDIFWLNKVNGTTTLADQCVSALEKMGPTYVKFGQALASRPDVVPRSLAQALSTLQDAMQPFDTRLAKEIIQHDLKSSCSSEQELQAFVASLSETPVAAASIGQVYSGRLPSGQKVAIKVQRPGISEIVQQDSTLLGTIVQLIESIPAIAAIQTDQERLVETDLSGAVDEFMSRIVEELDYRNEARNIQLFHKLYSHRREAVASDDAIEVDDRIEVVVPEVFMDLCTDRVLVMEWIDGTHLVDLETESSSRESLALIEQCIDCTLSQLLDTGVLHADPHGGYVDEERTKFEQMPYFSSLIHFFFSPYSNLLKVMDTTDQGETIRRLGYIDFGLLSTVPVTVRDGLVCAVAELVFARNVSAVADLFGELQLIPEEILSDPSQRAALAVELNQALTSVLKYDRPATGTATTIPTLRFDKLLDALTRMVPRFRFQLPPYFINNARALGTLEGMAREINPSFNVLQTLYPYILRRLLSNPTDSPVVEATLQSLIRSPVTGRVDSRRIQKLLDDSTILTGYSKRKVLSDILKSRNGPRLVKLIIKEQLRHTFQGRFSKMANYLRL
jgi:aarF domain-containing kinase